MASLISEIRVVPFFMGAAMLFLANRMWELGVLFDEGEIPLNWFGGVWPWYYLLASLLCFAYSMFPHRKELLAFSGALAVTSFASRAISVLFSIAEGTSNIADVQYHIAATVYVVAAFSTAIVWVQICRPATNLLIKRTTHTGRIKVRYQEASKYTQLKGS